MKKFVQKFLCTALVALVLSVSILPAFAQAQTQQTPVTTSGSAFQSAQTALPACGLGPVGDTEGTVEGCAVRFFYYVVLYPSAWLASIGGQVFDYFTAYTLDADSYRDGGFIEQGWRIVRDIANISFIFILLYVAITFVLGMQNQNAQKLIARIVLIALVINFSLFMTRAVVDAGNILGRVFYEKIVIQNDDLGDALSYKTLSAGILAYVNPQKLLTQEMFGTQHSLTSVDASTTSNGIGIYGNDADAGSNNLVAAEGSGFSYEVPAGFVILIILIAAAINLAIAWVFFSVAIYFVGRTLGLWIMMIMSPLAFASVSIPMIGENAKRFGFKDWFNKTLQLSFLVVIFMFFLFLTIMFLDVVFTTPFTASQGSTVQRIMSVIVPFAAVFFLLVTAKKQAKEMSGEFGSAVGKALKYAVIGAVGAAGITAGAAAAGAGMLGRQVIGRNAAKMAAGADTTTAKGRFIKKYGTKLSQSSFDARNVKIPKPAKDALGGIRSGLSYATDGAVSTGDLTANRIGKGSSKNYAQLKEDKIKKKVEDAKNYAPGDAAKVETLDHGGRLVTTSVYDAQKELDRKRIDAKQANDYDSKVKGRDKQKKVLDEVRRDYNMAIQDLRDGRITQIEFDSIKRSLDAAKLSHETKTQEVKTIEDMWKPEEVLYNNAKKALAKKKTEFFKKYSKEIDDWAAVPDLGLTHRYDANREAAAQVEDLGIREEKKEENKS